MYRLMLAIPMREFLARLRPLLADSAAGPPCREAVEQLGPLFGARARQGVRMAAEALRVGVPPDRVADVCTAFVCQVHEALEDG